MARYPRYPRKPGSPAAKAHNRAILAGLGGFGPSLFNTVASSTMKGGDLPGFSAAASALDARLTKLGY